MSTCPANCGSDSPDGLLCRTCTDKLERDLGDVPAIVADLDVTISRMDRVPSGGGSRQPITDPDEEPGLASIAHTRTPVGWRAVEARDDLGNCLTSWARAVLNEQVPWGRYANPTTAAARLLLSHMPEIRRHEAVAELCEGIHDGVRDARRAVDRPAESMFVGPCLFEGVDDEGRPVTCYEDLYASPGASEVRCKVCSTEHRVPERRAWLMRKAEDRIVTVRTAAQYLGQVGDIYVTEDRIRGYIRRKTLILRSVNDDAASFRLGDLIGLVLREDSKKRSA